MLSIARWDEGQKGRRISRDSVRALFEPSVHCAVVRQCSHLFSVHNCPSLRQGHPWTGGPSYSLLTISSISNACLGSLFAESTTCSLTKHPFRLNISKSQYEAMQNFRVWSSVWYCLAISNTPDTTETESQHTHTHTHQHNTHSRGLHSLWCVMIWCHSCEVLVILFKSLLGLQDSVISLYMLYIRLNSFLCCLWVYLVQKW